MHRAEAVSYEVCKEDESVVVGERFAVDGHGLCSIPHLGLYELVGSGP